MLYTRRTIVDLSFLLESNNKAAMDNITVLLDIMSKLLIQRKLVNWPWGV
jgi:hypothetical protein